MSALATSTGVVLSTNVPGNHSVKDYVNIMLRYKVDHCTDPNCARGWACFGYHNATERRRVPRGKLTEKAKKCPDMTSGPKCPRGDDCPYFHTMAEWFHPSAYKRGYHPDGETSCKVTLRKGDPLFCSFMHDNDDKDTIIKAREIALSSAEKYSNGGANAVYSAANSAITAFEELEKKRKEKEARKNKEAAAVEETTTKPPKKKTESTQQQQQQHQPTQSLPMQQKRSTGATNKYTPLQMHSPPINQQQQQQQQQQLIPPTTMEQSTIPNGVNIDLPLEPEGKETDESLLFLQGTVKSKASTQRLAQVSVDESQTFVFTESSLITTNHQEFDSIHEGDQVVFIPDTFVSLTAQKLVNDAFACCMVSSAERKNISPHMSFEIAKATLKNAWKTQLRFSGTFFATQDPKARDVLPPFSLLRSATMRDLRKKIAALTHIISENQYIVANSIVLPDDNEKRIDQIPMIFNNVSTDIRITVSSESRLLRWARFENWYNELHKLELLAVYENWGENLEVLQYYIKNTFSIIINQNLLSYGYDDPNDETRGKPPTLVCFNTGLQTNLNEAIYAVFESVQETNVDLRKWNFQSWDKESQVQRYFSSLPLPIEYFKSPEELVFQSKNQFFTDIDQIINDPTNKRRMIDVFRGIGAAEQMQRRLLGTALTMMKKRVKQNFRVAIPSFTNGHIEFLVPLSFNETDQVHIVLAVKVINKQPGIPCSYLGHNLLTVAMAYMNARVLSPLSQFNWLGESFSIHEPKNLIQFYRTCVAWARSLQNSRPGIQVPIETQLNVLNSIQYNVAEMVLKTHQILGIPLDVNKRDALALEMQKDMGRAPPNAPPSQFALALNNEYEPETICPCCGNAMLAERNPDTDIFTEWRCSHCKLNIVF